MLIRSLLIMILGISFLNAKIEVRKIKEVEEYTKNLTDKDLVVCDINLVLIRCKNPAFHLKNEENNKLTLLPFKWKMSKEEKDIFYSAIFAKHGMEILEKDSISFINDLNKKGIKTLAITTTYTGSLLDKDMTKEHHKWLKNHHFEKGFGKIRVDLDLDSGSKQRPFYENGILFKTSNDLPYSKGDVLKAFLEKVNFVKKEENENKRTYVLIDDVEKNLKKMGKAVKEIDPDANIIKIHYTGEYYMDTKEISSDEMKKAWDESYEIANKMTQEKESS